MSGSNSLAVLILLATPFSRGRASWSVAPVQVAPVLRSLLKYYELGGLLGHFSLMDSWTRSRGGIPIIVLNDCLHWRYLGLLLHFSLLFISPGQQSSWACYGHCTMEFVYLSSSVPKWDKLFYLFLYFNLFLTFHIFLKISR